MAKHKILYIPDTHFPFVDKKALKKVYDLIKIEKPTHIIQAGDLLDLYSFSRYEKDANYTTPKTEIEQGLEQAKEMWTTIKKLAPKAKCYHLIGNHEDRLSKTIAKKAPELAGFVTTIQDMYKFKGVKVLNSSKEHLELYGVIYCHGHYTKLGDHAKFYGKPVVHGHSHRIGIWYEQYDKTLLWEMDTGYLADESALPLQYTAVKYSKWTKAVGIVENGQPRIITL